MDAAKTLKIVRLEVENVKRLKAVNIEPNGNVVKIGGANAQGKSSVLDSIAMAIGGKKLCPVQPIRNGEAKARIAVDLGDLTVERKFTASGSTLTVRAKDGASYPSPQGMLDEMVSTLTFDPLEFFRAPKQAQIAALKEAAGLNTDDLEEKHKRLYDERVAVGRERDKAVGHALSMKTEMGDLGDLPEEEVSVKELVEELNIAQEINEGKSDADDKVSMYDASVKTLSEEIESLKDRLEDAEARLEHNKKCLSEWTTKRDQIEWVDVQEILERIEKAEETNQLKRSRDRLREAEETAKNLTDEYNRKSLDMRQVKDEIKKRVEACNLPLPGLWIDDGEIYLNGVPIEQLSSSERLRLSVAMGFAMHQTLKVMRIYDGSLLDAENLQMISEMAEAEDGQLWIERIGEGEEMSVIIHDGEVV